MTDVKFNSALIVGAGSGLSASLARALAREGIKVALASRSTGDLEALIRAGRASSVGAIGGGGGAENAAFRRRDLDADRDS